MRILILSSCFFLSSLLDTFAESSNALAVQRILEGYTESLGGPRMVEALSSLSIEGVQTQGGQRYDFLIRKKRPGAIRYRISLGENSIICGRNKGVGWQRTKVGDLVSIADLSVDQSELLAAESQFDSPLFRHLEKPWNSILLLGNEQLGDTHVTVLEVKQFGEPFRRYYLNSRSGLIVKRVQIHSDGSDGLETSYRDYRAVDGYQFAYEIENRIGDQLLSLVEIDSIKVNPGLLNFYFERPLN